MATVQELKGMLPLEVYGEALKSGKGVALKETYTLTDRTGQTPLQKFYQDHPEFTDERVKALLEAGEAQDLLNTIRDAHQSPSVVGVLNVTPDGDEFFTLEKDVKKPVQTQEKKKRFFGLF